MKKLLSRCLRPFSFESLEMKNSYFLFNHEVEMKLLGLIQALATTSISVLAFLSLFFNRDFIQLSMRIGLIVCSLLLLLVRKKGWVRFYKFAMTFYGGAFLLYMMYFVIIAFAGTSTSHIFLTANGLGMFEIALVLSFKMPSSRFLILMMFSALKIICLYEEIIIQPRPYIHFVIFVLHMFVFCLYHDILDRRIFGLIYQAGQKIKKFQDLLSNDLPSSVIIMPSNFSSILYSNKFFQQNFSPNTSVENTGKSIKNLFHKLTLEGEHQKESKLDRSSEPTSVSDYLIRISSQSSEQEQDQDQEEVRIIYASHKDEETGSESHYEVRLRRILWDGKHSYAIVMNDITDKELVTALKIADAQKDRVIATVSHELRTPINGILGLLEMASDIAYDRTLLGYLENCKSCSKLLLYLVNAILDLSQIRSNNLKIIKNSFKITQMLEEVKSLYIFQTHQKGIEFIIEKGSSVDEEIYTDKYRLIEVLINLIGNAMKFTFKGFVKLKISRSEQREEDLIFCVEDTGLGIKEEDKDKLFKMFGKIEHSNRNINTHGVGLGLTIANELVKALNPNHDDPKIMVESEFEKGSRFWFSLDIHNPNNTSSMFLDVNFEEINSEVLDSQDFKEFPQSAQTIGKKLEKLNLQDRFNSETNRFFTKEGDHLLSPKNFDETARRKVLLVDDNPLNLMAAGFILEKIGFSITKALNGQEGINLLEESVKTKNYYSLVLTDIQMPIMDGLEMSKKITERIIKQEIYPVPIIALTAKKFDQKELEKYKECGIELVLEKPLVKNEIERIINDFVK